MKKLGIAEAFRQYNARLRNRMWAVSALSDGSVVMSLWAHKFKTGMVYEDRLSRWNGPGNKLFREHLEAAYRDNLPIRVVIATSMDPVAVDRGDDASKIPKTFHIRPDLIGRVEEFDRNDCFRIRFQEA